MDTGDVLPGGGFTPIRNFVRTYSPRKTKLPMYSTFRLQAYWIGPTNNIGTQITSSYVIKIDVTY